MQIVIDIPDYDYKHIKEYYEKNDNVEATYSYIYHGIPLPKGHGRLIDADELYDSLEFPTQQFASAFKQVLDDAPTIIEAERSDKK